MAEVRIGLALAGGGARGAAHIAVLKVLHENDIPIHRIAGSSAGAIIGAMYCASESPDWIEEKYRKFLSSRKFKLLGVRRIQETKDRKSTSFMNQIGHYLKGKFILTVAQNRKGLLSSEKLLSAIESLLPVMTFEELKIPLTVVATDLNSGQEIIYTEGDLVEAVTHSSLIPGYLVPVNNSDRLIVDGVVSAPLPINALLNCDLDFTIAVDISRREVESLQDYNIIDLLARTEHVASVKLVEELTQKADVVIRPEVKDAHWSEFDRTEELMSCGTEAAKAALPAIRAGIEEKRKVSYKFRKWLKAKL
ncbi:MAG: patatin-like phospholipase family protein [Fidelibacterota bacterium]